jgi:stage V sporulation protein AD
MQESYELCEVEILERCYKGLLKKINLKPDDVDILIGGDLLNQLTTTTYAVKPFGIPYWGIYNACSTFSLGLQISACSIEGGAVHKAIVSASSHFCTSERQYRSPLELGNQNPPTAQRTVTGSGCVFVTDFGQGPYISACTTGRVVDFEQKDPYDMGTAMAPAAFDTILAHFKATQTDFSDYDAVFTGDLAAIGHEIVTRMFEDQKIKVRNYYDCGCMMYDKGKQYVNATEAARDAARLFYAPIF